MPVLAVRFLSVVAASVSDMDQTAAAAAPPGARPAGAAALARHHAYAADPAGYVARGRTARTDRRVTVRPAPDTMSVLSGFLPVEQGVACWAALRAHTDTVKNTGDTRTRDQIMADTLVERLTGQTRAGRRQAEIAIVIPVDALTDPDARPAPAPASTGGRGRRRCRGPRLRPLPTTRHPRRIPRPALVAAAVHRPPRRHHRRRPAPAAASTAPWPP